MRKVLVLLSFSVLFSGCSRISDQDLSKRYAENRELFSELNEMAQEDPALTRLTFDLVDSGAVTLPEDRIDRYRKLLSRLHIDNGISRPFGYGESTFYNVDSEGLVTGGASIGFVYSKEKLEPVVDRIVFEEYNQRGIVYRLVEGNWYVYYRVD